ncbi:MAG: AI-2E family transporter [Flavobacteriales bacterium]|jgi:predicted PurR-regulated permease PerM|nr:AI-2E family transporter [Flavobacteriales bacterium]|tara:strand:+ start:30 stop:1157 length:1128 start_codon:yes stop_codon:yes gene_type:complete
MNISFQKLFFALATSCLVFVVLIFAKSILIPLAFALFLSFILFPLTKRFERWGMNDLIAAFLSIFIVFLVLSGGIYIFSAQLIGLSKELTDFQEKVLDVIANATVYINNNINFVEDLNKDQLLEENRGWLQKTAGALAQQTFNSTANFITGLFATIIFTFLILIYRKGLTKGFVAFAAKENHNRIFKMLKSIQQVGQQYLFGMILLIIIIGLANSFGLMIIGVDHPFLFGFFAATLSIIPYIGTAFGAIIPILYTMMAYNSFFMGVQVAILFWAVQLITDNFLSPKIVGGSLKINALTTILSLIIGATIWGVAGMVLFLPFAAMLKVICQEFDTLKPIALLIGTQDSEEENKEIFINKWKKKIAAWRKKLSKKAN